MRLSKGVLDLAMELVVANEATGVGAHYLAVGRLANAAVAVLGPDLRLGSPAYVKTRALLRIAQVCPTSSVGFLMSLAWCWYDARTLPSAASLQQCSMPAGCSCMPRFDLTVAN